ncbi:protein mono-ADP-ribosyltransferase PARP12 [Eucyclogobius newberryi]|uniref:protein mono-ADP-ribosyltransferase PARP12 n=1 Tax=Eucyclogobius newberryi TaxID=166745 RepID=UPI003B5AB1EC
MAKVVYKFILQALCNNQGSLDFRSLNEQISQHYTVEEELLQAILFDDGKIAIQEGKEKASGGGVISPDCVVVAKTSLRLCQAKSCQGCDKLHLCRYYVCGECTFKEKCKNPHSLTSPENAKILEECDVQGLTEKQLFQLLLQNDPYLLPEICSHYNKGEGESGSCKFTTTCTKLHMCQHFLRGDCTFGSSCKRAHAIDAQGMKLFKLYSKENITGLYKIYRNRLIIQGQKARPAALPEGSCPTPRPLAQALPSPSKQTSKPTGPASLKGLSDSDRSEICQFFLRRDCKFNERCARVHWHLPYKWEMREGESMKWKSMDNMEEIEKAFCDPANDTSCTDDLTSPSGLMRFLSFASSSAAPSVDFIKMIYGTSPVRRLTTSSSVSHPPNYILTTQWLWYWKDETGAWLEYGQDGTGMALASLTSQTLENVYLTDKNAEIEFTAGKHKYKIHFAGANGLQMCQKNMRFNTIREVRRRPHFVSAHEVEAKLKSGSSSSQSSSSSAAAVPSNWDKNALPEIGYKLVPLSTSAKEYHMIEMLFMATMPQSRITRIQRIQNPSLWRVFQWQREQMHKRNDDNPVNEKHLFHGTDKSIVEAICDQNFDWRMCGVHGTAYGKGSYFAQDASYSNKYATGHRGKVMFVALVLVGDYTKGQGQYVRPPPKKPGTTLYDSCVDNVTNPKIFVIFEKQQVYPEYLIEYI